MRRFRFLRNPLPTQIGNNVQEFLHELGGPACLFLDGEDRIAAVSLDLFGP